jgi:hypothetical protein
VSGFATQLAAVCSLLNREGARYVLVGRRALQLWGSAVAGRDIEILIEPTPANAARVLRALREAGFGFAREWLAEEIGRKAVTVIGAGPRTHILTVALSVPYQDAAPEAHEVLLEGVPIPTASLDHLIASKRTGRAQDDKDLGLLEDIQLLQGT